MNATTLQIEIKFGENPELRVSGSGEAAGRCAVGLTSYTTDAGERRSVVELAITDFQPRPPAHAAALDATDNEAASACPF